LAPNAPLASAHPSERSGVQRRDGLAYVHVDPVPASPPWMTLIVAP
jgi:hypothetical protein